MRYLLTEDVPRCRRRGDACGKQLECLACDLHVHRRIRALERGIVDVQRLCSNGVASAAGRAAR